MRFTHYNRQWLRLRPVLTACCLLSIVHFLYGCAVNPVTGQQELAFITEEEELAIGRENYPVTTQINNGLFQDDSLQAYVVRVGKRVADVSHRSNLQYEFNVANTSDINAYALPGGKISITRGLLVRLENEDQLAGILGHEVGHVTARHAVAQISKTMLTQAALVGLGVSLASMDVRNRELYNLSSGLAAGLLLLRYSRDQESQSDHLGLEYMAKAGYNPRGLKQAMEIIKASHEKEPSRLEALLLTHPLTSDRVEAIDGELSRTYAEPGQRPFKMDEFQATTSYIKGLKDAYAYYDKGDEFMGKRRYREAEEEYRRAIAIDDKQAVFHTGLAWALLKQKALTPARRSVDRALELYPNLFSSRFIGGVISYESEDYGLAFRDLRKADDLVPGVPEVKLYIARSYEAMGDRRLAIGYYKETLRLDPQGSAGKEARRKLTMWGIIRPSK
ncbi:MAG: M48 family metalloprotease [Deltaproteobacteria bacterium]|nr:M48 family metalloprotease [Deltaproteobacteria bacterium]